MLLLDPDPEIASLTKNGLDCIAIDGKMITVKRSGEKRVALEQKVINYSQTITGGSFSKAIF